MIIDDIVKIKKNPTNTNYYNNLNYEVNSDKYFEVHVKDLPKNSHVNIRVKCDLCKTEKTISYCSYRRNIENNEKNIYTCIKCSKIKSKKTNLLRYGTEYPIQNENIKKKRKENNIKKYGVDETAKLKKSIDKVKETKQEKYGNENYNNNSKNKITKIERYNNVNYNNRDKSIQTCLSKYDVNNISKITQVKEKKKKTFLKNFGVDNFSKSNEFKNKRKNFLSLKYDNISFISVNKDTLSLECDRNKKHQYVIDLSVLRNRLICKTVLCTICNPVNSYSSSGGEIQLQEFIENNYVGKILLNSRKIIKPYELDIYLPDLKLAFEYNGLFFHSELKKDKNYHMNKTDACEKIGIRLIQIYEDDWNNKKEIMKSIILKSLNESIKLYANDCQIREIKDNTFVKNFLNINHLQGFMKSKIKLGLFHDEEIVSMMLFKSIKKSKILEHEANSYEMLRFCDKLNTVVIGATSMLFKYFINTHNPENVISYSDRSWESNDEYISMGFELLYKTSPNYFNIINKKRKCESIIRRKISIKEEERFDSNEIKYDNKPEKKSYGIYDSGYLKFIYIKN